MKQMIAKLLAAITALGCMVLPVSAAAVDNPNTGDPAQTILTVVIVALIISAVLIAAYLIWSAKNKGKKKKKK